MKRHIILKVAHLTSGPDPKPAPQEEPSTTVPEIDPPIPPETTIPDIKI